MARIRNVIILEDFWGGRVWDKLTATVLGFLREHFGLLHALLLVLSVAAGLASHSARRPKSV
jgi:hypothetical protein